MDWGIAIGLALGCIAAGYGAFAVQHHAATRVLFALSWMILEYKIVNWGATMDLSAPMRILTVAVFGAVITVSAVELILFTNRSKVTIVASPSQHQPLAMTSAPLIPAPHPEKQRMNDAPLLSGERIQQPLPAQQAARPKVQPSGPASIDAYTNNGVNNGYIGRNEGTVNIGKQPFVMTEAIMADVLAKIDRASPVTLYAIGPSIRATNELANYLATNGIHIAAINTIGQWTVAGIDVPQVPIIIGGPAPAAGRVPGSVPIVVDVTK
jgi:hypothetical protein